VVVGPGRYSRVGGFSYLSSFPDNALALIGAGSGQTVLANPAAAGNGSTLQVSGAGSIVRDLKTILAPGGNNTGLGISGGNAVARNVVVAGDPATTNGTGVRVDAGAALRSASVVGTGPAPLRHHRRWALLDTTVDTTASGYGISGPHIIQRVAVRGALVGILNRGGTAGYKLDQLVLAVPAGALGVVASATATTTTTVTADHLTIVGDGSNTSIGASTTDRDGLPRLVGAASDMGAYEVQ
jgi:hypothetical protein